MAGFDASSMTDSIDNINWSDGDEILGVSVSSYFESVDLFLSNDIINSSQPTNIIGLGDDSNGFTEELLEAKARFDNGEVASYEEVFGEPQPDL